MKHLYIFLLLIVITNSCNETKREQHIRIISDKISHSGDLKGYVPVYETNYADDTFTRSETTYPIYYNSDGTYTIVYNNESYILQELETPFIPYNGIELKYKMSSRFYIEDIPNSY